MNYLSGYGYMRRIMRKKFFIVWSHTKMQISGAVTLQLISDLVDAANIVKSSVLQGSNLLQ